MTNLPPISVTNAPLVAGFTHVLGIFNDAGASRFARMTLADFRTQLNLSGGGSSSWGGIGGTLSNQTDLQAALDGKSNLAHVHVLADVTGLTAALAGKQGSLGFTAENIANKGVASGYAALDANGFVPASQLPASFVDDVQEFSSFSAFPPVGTDSIQYVDIAALKVYRWSGSAYTEVSASPGSTDVLAEGATNKYFTVARVIASTLTGLSVLSNTVVVAADTVLGAIGKLQAQMTAHFGTGGTAHAAVTTTVAGFMSAADKTKLDGVSAGASVNATHTGDVTGAGVLTIAAAAVSNTKMANVNTATIKGRITAADGAPEDLTGTQATTLLDVFTTSLKGLVPASGGGTANFLRADGTWAAPPVGGSAAWGAISGTLSNQTDLQTALNGKQASGAYAAAVHTHAQADVTGLVTALEGKEPTITAGTATQYLKGDKTLATLDKAAVGLGNVDNTSDAAKPVSTAAATALAGKEPTITAGTATQYIKGDKTLATLDKAAVGLGNVDNTSDAAKPVSTATATALAGKAATAHSHVAADVSDFAESVDDRVAALLVAGTNVTLTYNDAGNTLTIAATGGEPGLNYQAVRRLQSILGS
jgi:hypothetical protein